MKRIIISCVLLCTTYLPLLPFVGTVTEDLFLPTSSETTVVQFIQQPFEATQMPYTPGGLILIYPTGLFTIQPPLVFVTIQLNLLSDPLSTYLAVVDASSDTTGCTITVYKVLLIGGVFTEAGNGEVDVSILALANPAE